MRARGEQPKVLSSWITSPVEPSSINLASPRAANQNLEIIGEQGEQVPVADIPGGNHEQPSGRPAQQMAVTEVTILRDDHPVFSIANPASTVSVVRFPSGSSDVCVAS
jgi:hypothetical protein